MQFLDQFFDVLAFGVSIHRAWILHTGSWYLFLNPITSASDTKIIGRITVKIHPVQIGVGRKTVKASFIKRDIIIVSITSLFMMGIGVLLHPSSLAFSFKGAFAHFLHRENRELDSFRISKRTVPISVGST